MTSGLFFLNPKVVYDEGLLPVTFNQNEKSQIFTYHRYWFVDVELFYSCIRG